MSEGPYTCCRCCSPTWNDSDWCDSCEEEARREIAEELADDAEEAA